MNRMMRTLAAGSLVSLTSLLGWAADRDWADSETPAPKSKRIVVKDARPSSVKPRAGVRAKSAAQETMPPNYYQELFNSGRKPSEPSEPAEDSSARLMSNRTAKKPISVASPSTEQEPFESDDDWPQSAASGVKTARFGQDDGAKKPIKQVRVDVRPKSARIPVPPAKSRGSAPAPSASAPPAPLAGPQVSSLSLEWVKKSELNVGQECHVELVVKNTGTSPVEQVAVDALIQAPVRLTSASPQPVENRDRLTWNFASLPPDSEQRIALSLIPVRRGDLGLVAQVRVTGSAAAAFHVEEPLLQVALKGPTEITLGDSASQMVVVSNPGTGAAHDVKIVARASKGLQHARGGETVEMDIGTISPGESRTVRLPLTGLKGGEQTLSVTASAGAELTASASATMNVISPSLSVAADGPALRYKGRNARYTIHVANDGSVANNNIRVVQSLGEGFRFVSADHGGKFDPTSKTVSWFIGRLEPGQSADVSSELNAVSLGDFTHHVLATSDAGARGEATVQTQVDGTPSLTMEVADVDDPVEVGVETAYEIRVRNEGSKAASNVVVSCELPAGVQLISAKGATDARIDRRTLTFRPLSQLAPGQDSVFRIQVKGIEEGQHRIQARVSSDSLEEPLLKEEQTKFYSDVRR